MMKTLTHWLSDSLSGRELPVHILQAASDPAVGQQRPCDSDCLTPGRGDSGFFQPVGFASFAGQTKKTDWFTPIGLYLAGTGLIPTAVCLYIYIVWFYSV